MKDLTLKKVSEEMDLLMKRLKENKEQSGQSDKGRLVSIAITHLETAQLFVDKAEQQ